MAISQSTSSFKAKCKVEAIRFLTPLRFLDGSNRGFKTVRIPVVGDNFFLPGIFPNPAGVYIIEPDDQTLMDPAFDIIYPEVDFPFDPAAPLESYNISARYLNTSIIPGEPKLVILVTTLFVNPVGNATQRDVNFELSIFTSE